jgi:hypothetical protein
MKFATLPNQTLDGQLLLVSTDLQHACDASDLAPNLITALQNWDAVLAPLQQRLCLNRQIAQHPCRAARSGWMVRLF